MRQMPIRPKPKQTGAKDSFNTVADNTQANHDGIVTAIKTPMYLDSLEQKKIKNLMLFWSYMQNEDFYQIIEMDA